MPETQPIKTETILLWLDRAIAMLAHFKDIIPGKVDDLAHSFLTWARNDPTFVSWLGIFEPAADGALTMPPEPLLDAFRRWNTETGAAADTTGAGFMELIGYILAIITWIQKRKGQPAPA